MKSGTVLLILLAIAAIAVFLFMQIFDKSAEVNAKKFFEEDLVKSYPYADVREILSVKKVRTGYDDYYVLKARVSSGLDTPCPERIEVEYNYPSKNFVKTDEKIVSGCSVCIDEKQNCIIAYPEEAIIASHTFEGTKRIKDFIDINPGATPSAQLLNNYGSYKNVWRVDWTQNNEDSQQTITAYISQNDSKVIEITES